MAPPGHVLTLREMVSIGRIASNRVRGAWRSGVLFGLLTTSALLSPSVAHAHVKWFIDGSRYPLRPELVASSVTAAFIGLALAALIGLSFLQRLLGDAGWPRFSCWPRLELSACRFLAALASVGVAGAAVQSTLLAPNLVLPPGPLSLAFVASQLLVVITFVTGRGERLGAAILIALVGSAAFMFGPLAAAEQLHWAGIGAIGLAVNGRRAAVSRKRAPVQARSLAVLRMLTGAAIVTCALTEKLWDPDLGVAFLAEHPAFNLLRLLGVWSASDAQFVLVAGLAEGVVGVLLASGLLIRPVALGACVLFALGIPFLPAQELLGHLPILGSLSLLAVHGSGTICDWRRAATALRSTAWQPLRVGRTATRGGVNLQLPVRGVP